MNMEFGASCAKLAEQKVLIQRMKCLPSLNGIGDCNGCCIFDPDTNTYLVDADDYEELTLMPIRAEPGRIVILRKMCDLCSLEMERNKSAEKAGKWGLPDVYEYRCKNGHVDSDEISYPKWEIRPMPKEKVK